MRAHGAEGILSGVPDRVVTDSSFSHLARVPLERVDLVAWLARLTNAEFRRCCPGEHLAAGASTTDDHRPLTVAAEAIGDEVFVHRYRREVAERHRCRLVSTSDVFGPRGHAVAHMVWELDVMAFDEFSCECSNRLLAATDGDRLALTDAAAAAHGARETPLLAASVERHALGAPHG
jgi:hypothetical protein